MIEFRDISFRYPGETTCVLNRLSLHIPDKGMTAIMGANGSGKSTAALCMNGILVPETGKVLVDGKATGEKSNQSAVRDAVGIVFQNPNHQFTSLTVERELAFGLENLGTDVREMRDRVEEHLRLFELEKHRSMLPGSLSGGERQRVALASVVVRAPKYLVLDEATSLLSPMSRKAILRDATARLQRSVVLITQFPEEAILADHLFVLEKGSVARHGPPAEIFRDPADLQSLGIRVPLSLRLGIDAHIAH